MNNTDTEHIAFQAREKLGRQLLENIDGMEKSSMTPADILRHLKLEIESRIKPPVGFSQTPEC